MNHKDAPIFPVFQSEILSKFQKDGLQHGFFGKDIPFHKDIAKIVDTPSLLGEEEIQQNQSSYEKIASYFHIAPSRLILAAQSHSNHVVTVNEENYQEPFKADGLVTKCPLLALGVLTADCVPIIFYEKKHHIIGIAHAGWRGAHADIVENLIQSIEALGGDRSFIYASLGPSISADDYEIDEDFKNNFCKKDQAYSQFFQKSAKKGHFLFDLWQFILYQCQKSAIKADLFGLSTYRHEKLFFSYRANFHNNRIDKNRQLSAVMLKT